MARTLTPGFEPLATEKISTAHYLTETPEKALSENVQHLWGIGLTPQVVLTDFGTVNGFVESTTTSFVLFAEWQYRIDQDFGSLTVVCNGRGSGGYTGVARFLVVGSATTLDLTLPNGPGSPQVGTLACATSGVMQMWVKCSAGGSSTTVYDVAAYATPKASVPAGVAASGYVATDSAEYAEDAPLSVELRQRQSNNLAILHERRDTYIAWSDDLSLAGTLDGAFHTLTTSPKVVGMFFLPRVRAPYGLDYAIQGLCNDGPGGWELWTRTMANQIVPTKYTGTVNGTLTWYAGATPLDCVDGADEVIYLTTYCDGRDPTTVAGLSVWPAEAP